MSLETNNHRNGAARCRTAVDAPPPVLSVTIGTDGRLYCHDVTPQLLPMLVALCGSGEELERRCQAAASLEMHS